MFNADGVVEQMVRCGKRIEDAREGGTSGCVETGAFGKEAYILTGYLNTPKILEITLNNGTDPRTGKRIGIETGDPREFDSFDDLFAAFEKQLRHFVEIKVRGNQIIEQLYARQMPAVFLSVLIDDCIKKGKDYNAGGARYNTSYIQCVGIGTITDSLSAIAHVFGADRKGHHGQLLDALASGLRRGRCVAGPLIGPDAALRQRRRRKLTDHAAGVRRLYDGHRRPAQRPRTASTTSTCCPPPATSTSAR
jgi:pyruvate-formate lyase